MLGPLIGLQMEHVYRRVLRGDADLGYALDHWTMLPSFIDGSGASPPKRTAARRGPGRLAAAMRAAGGDATRFTGRMQAWLEPFLERALARWRSVAPKDSWYGCFRYSVSERRGWWRATFTTRLAPSRPLPMPRH